MNDRPDRLVYGQPVHTNEDTQPNIPPQRGEDAAADPSARPTTAPYGDAPAGHPAHDDSANDHPAHDTVPPNDRRHEAGPAGDVLERETPLTDADRATAVQPDPAHPDPAHLDPAHSGAVVAPAGQPAHHAARTSSLFDHDPEDLRRRWQEVQAGFVDDPRDAVERADSLLEEVTSSVRRALEARATELQGHWKDVEQNDTEQLRTALRDYRSTLEELLGLPVTSAGTR
ncbi:hypothetical protein ACFFMN_17445 [Planobispora siamensis]|uniref:Uncharacterized protein n=1 Tax=Planobispora siamensis TaxID=936338 RepID=A0A8J3SKV0_9ACTN|nr:hypothetical protein [Planobispora siamensis]GIH95099.1 hypothetical protein Psi01_57290 [Planobispora siamensis]